jgi:hypothetical protein
VRRQARAAIEQHDRERDDQPNGQPHRIGWQRGQDQQSNRHAED